MPTDFIDLEIRLLKRDEQGYPIELNDITKRLQFRGGYLSADITNWTSAASQTEDGKKLFAALFGHAETKQAWDRLRGPSKTPRRLRLSIDATAPELHALPWELLYDDTMLAADAQTPFSRYLAGEWEVPAPESTRPLKMLVVIANPSNLLKDYTLPAIDVSAEQAVIESAFVDFTPGQVERVYLPQPITLTALAEAMQAGYHLWHIVAHGTFNKRRGEAMLYLANANNDVEPVFESDFADMLQRQTQKPRLIFLAACQSATRNSSEAFRGFAPRLVAAGAPTVLAMQDLVPVETARSFSRAFYAELFAHGQVDLASNQARAHLLTAKLAGGAIPVLFSRLSDNKLLQQIHPDKLSIIKTKPYEPETVLIPAGPFLMGHGETQEAYQHEVTLPLYRIGKYPVTNKQYGEFIKRLKDPAQRLKFKPKNWFGTTPSTDILEHPVIEISWHEAMAYCAWLSEDTGRKYRLPSEAEWEKAARGTDGRLYPWGNEWREGYCNDGKAISRNAKVKTTLVTQYPQGASPYGCLDMVGNVCEWTLTLWGTDPQRSEFPYPYQADDGREDTSQEMCDDRWQRILRGRSANENKRDGADPNQLYTTARFAYAPNGQNKNWGFRVMCEIG